MTTEAHRADEPAESGGVHAFPASTTPQIDAPPGGSPRSARPIGHRLVYVAVLAVGFVTRLAIVLTSEGGLTGRFTSYDTGVYYAAADAFSFGRLPYRDFVLLHPPGSMLALTPFAALGHLIGDHAGFMIAVLATMLLGGVNAALVSVVARQMGLSLPAAAAGGLFYAIWPGSVQAEYLTRLEPLGNFLVLCGLLAFVDAERTGRRRPAVWAGAAFAAAASVKIWWAVPLLLLVAWHLVRGRRQRLLPVTAGAVVTLVVINGPFFLAAPSAMWHMVVTDQLDRHRTGLLPLSKASYLISADILTPDVSRAALGGLVVVAAAVAVALSVSAWRLRAARFAVLLAVTQACVLAVAPSWFGFYADYLTPAAAVTVAAGWGAIRWRAATLAARMATVVPVVAVVAVAAAATGRALVQGNDHVVRFPTAPLASATRDVRCLMSDEQTALILLDALSRGMRNGCRNWVDVTGRTYGQDKLTSPDGGAVDRVHNQVWQRDLRAYLLSGDAVILTREKITRANASTLRAVRSGGVLARAGSWVVYRTLRGP